MTTTQTPAPEATVTNITDAPSATPSTTPEAVADRAAQADAKAAVIRQGAAEAGIPTRATWKQHGNPLSGFEFWGTAVKQPELAKAKQVASVTVDSQGITLKAANGRAIPGGSFGSATKFWAIVPQDAPRKAAPERATREPAAKADPIVINAPKGGTQTVAPRKGEVAKAIKATGKSIAGLAREFGQNPAQLRRLSLDLVAKVDLVRAESIAAALGTTLDALFEAPVDKAKAAPKGNGTPKGTADPATVTKTTKTRGKSKTQKAEEARARRVEASQDAAEADEAKFGPQDSDLAAEAEAAQAGAEGSQAE